MYSEMKLKLFKIKPNSFIRWLNKSITTVAMMKLQIYSFVVSQRLIMALILTFYVQLQVRISVQLTTALVTKKR